MKGDQHRSEITRLRLFPYATKDRLVPAMDTVESAYRDHGRMRVRLRKILKAMHELRFQLNTLLYLITSCCRSRLSREAVTAAVPIASTAPR